MLFFSLVKQGFIMRKPLLFNSADHSLFSNGRNDPECHHDKIDD
jgi:hypothetical protein